MMRKLAQRKIEGLQLKVSIFPRFPRAIPDIITRRPRGNEAQQAVDFEETKFGSQKMNDS